MTLTEVANRLNELEEVRKMTTIIISAATSMLVSILIVGSTMKNTYQKFDEYSEEVFKTASKSMDEMKNLCIEVVEGVRKMNAEKKAEIIKSIEE